MGSDDLDNVAVAVTAHGVAPGTRVDLRAGEHEAIAETRSLLSLGTTRDVTALSATYVVARLLGTAATAVVVHDDQAYVDVPGKGFVSWPTSPREQCGHVQPLLPEVGPGQAPARLPRGLLATRR